MRILEDLWETRINYKGVTVNMLGIPMFNDGYKKRYFSNQISRLEKRGLIYKKGDAVSITKMGQEYVKKKQESFLTFSSEFKKSAPKNLVVMFDIPEIKKAEREWFRFHLKKFDYIMIQRSVWVGPSPLPKDFRSYLDEIKLRDCIKTFKLAKPF